MIRSLELREGAPGMVMDLAASGALVYTSFRDAEGALVVELPNTLADEAVNDFFADEGLVRSVTVERQSDGDRPLLRLKLATREEVEHGLAADGNLLRLTLTPLAAPVEKAELSYEPLPEESAPAPEPARDSVTVADGPTWDQLGTADNPDVSPPPVGAAATRLRNLEALDDDNYFIEGDGEFLYSSFRLDGPERFVIDLSGVVDTSKSPTIPIGSKRVERVRVAQFKPFPDPVSRVVFDLNGKAAPTIERGADGLVVRFGPMPTGSITAPAPETRIAAAEPTPVVVDPEPVEAEPAMADPVDDEPLETGIVSPEPVVTEVQDDRPTYAEPKEETIPTPTYSAPDPYEAPRNEEALAMPQAEPAPPAPRPRRVPAFTTSDDTSSGGPAEQRVFKTKVFSGQVIASGEKSYTGEPIDMSLRDADVVETLRSFAAISGLSVVVQPGVSGSVTVELNNVPWDQALEQILKINGLGYELEGTIMRIAPVSVLRTEAEEEKRLAQAKAEQTPLQTVIKRLSYSDASELSALLRNRSGLLSSRGSVIVDRRTNTLIIKELPSFIDVVRAVIEEIDLPEPQVMIEARIIETTKRFTRSLGVDWFVDGVSAPQFGNTTGLNFPNQGTATGGVNLVTGADNGFIDLSLGNVLNTFNLDIALRAAENEGLIKILSSPKIATLNNERASIQSGLQIPVQTVANNTVTVQFINATLSLDVVPHVTAEGTVLMDINIRKREPQLAFAVTGAANAPIATKEARTRVIVRDGGTTVIGGIYEVTSDQGEDRVPGLSNIPIIRHLFKNKRRTDENEELLIFITPRVVNL